MSLSVRVRHLALRCRDLAQTRRFYEEGLGLRFIDYRPSGEAIDLSDGHINLTLIAYTGPDRTAFEEGTEFIHLGFWVADLAAVYQRLLALGATIVREDVKERQVYQGDLPPSGSFKVLDPDGNVLDISGLAEEWRY